MREIEATALKDQSRCRSCFYFPTIPPNFYINGLDGAFCANSRYGAYVSNVLRFLLFSLIVCSVPYAPALDMQYEKNC